MRTGFVRIAAPVAVVTVASVGVGVIAAPQAATAARNYFSTTKTVSGSGSASCGYGWKLSGGGVGELPSDSYSAYSSSEYQLRGSFPQSNAWRASATVTRGTFSSSSGWRYSTSSYTPRVWAVCIR